MSKFCQYCGTQLPDTALNCSNCGAAVQAQNAQPVQPAQPVPPTYYPPQPQQQMAPVTGIKQFMAYIWLPALLGMVTCGIGSLILTIVWACDKNNPNRRNYACATLISSAIIIGIYVLLFVILMIAGVSLSEAMSNSYYY